MLEQKDVIGRVREATRRIEPELIRIRHELHQYPELGVDLPKTHEIISRDSGASGI